MEPGVRLHRDTAKFCTGYLFMMFIGGAGWAAAWYGEATSRYTNTKPYQFIGAATVLFGVCALASLLWSFYLHVDDSGITFRLRGATTRLPWESVELLFLTKVGDGTSSPILKIRLAPGARLRRRWAEKWDDRRTYDLLDLDFFALPPEQVIAVLQRYGNDKVDAEEYLNYRAAVRRVAQWQAEREPAREKTPRKPWLRPRRRRR
ncbi:hypothetical protein ACQEVC_25200 [Plantactinospora sp. CA-294935]|uniref:hypothetical protein n=1 Tax=Plantactinospora sp. CA-294935 TaxID=3240012 RepID=UPI003D8E14AE